MGNFRNSRSSFGGGRDRDRGSFNRGGSRGGFGDRGDRPRRRMDMVDVVCDKCGKNCQVPFKPTEGKPVYCSECFRQTDNFRDRDNRNSFNDRGMGRNEGSSNASSGMSKDQFNEINTKLDKILGILEMIEFEDDSEEDEESEEDLEEEETEAEDEKESKEK